MEAGTGGGGGRHRGKWSAHEGYSNALCPGFFFFFSQWTFLPDTSCRQFLVLPPVIQVDYRAACLCHQRLVTVAYVCSVCLSGEAIACIAQVALVSCVGHLYYSVLSVQSDLYFVPVSLVLVCTLHHPPPTTDQDTFQATYKHCKREEEEDPTPGHCWTGCGSKLTPPLCATVRLSLTICVFSTRSAYLMCCINYLKQKGSML